jgi:hypothetical protein
MSRSSVLLDDGAPHSEDCAFALKSAAALAASNVSAAVGDQIVRLLPALALPLISVVGTPSCVNTNDINSPTSVQTAGSGDKGRQRVPFDVSHFLPCRPIGSCSRSSAALFTRRSRPAQRALDRRWDRGLAWTAHYHFRDRALRAAYGNHGPP